MTDRSSAHGSPARPGAEPGHDEANGRGGALVAGPEQPAEALPGALTETSYALPEGLPFARWCSIGQALQQLERSIQWWLGDWWSYGEARFGEEAAQAIKDLTGYERSTVWNYASVCRAFPPGTRVPRVSFFHHRALQSLARADPEAARALLREVDGADRKPTVEEFRAEVRRAARERALAGPPAGRPDPPGVDLRELDATRLPFEDGSLEGLIVTSPPYGLGKPYRGFADEAGAWPAFTRDWLREARRVMAPGSRLALNVALDTARGGFRPTYAEAVHAALLAGWAYRSTIIWDEGNLSKSTGRGSRDSPQAVHVVAAAEAIAVFSKGEWRRDPTGRAWDLEHEEWLAWTSGVWRFPGEGAPWELHPAAFPRELPRRLIKLLSFRDDVICDFFVGSGTTAVAAWQLGRRFVGGDVDPAMVESARRRRAAASGRGAGGG